MSVYTEYFLGSDSEIVELELLEISHFRFSQTYRIQRSSTEDVVATHEGGGGPFTYTYFPLEIRRVGAQNDLDQSLRIDLGDLGSVLPFEIDNVLKLNGNYVKPTLKYRTYKSTDLTAPMFGPQTYEITSINFNKVGCSFEAQAPRLNILRTGMLYTKKTFPMLEAFFKKH